ncbi:hypothetical protein PoB_005374200 [Plakobranchus ocellatus]|uniref:CUB domain-containing protein n=1 Tax=Plakobranchus ocellatus TaxID=259542 RepID=A0AAV4C6N4_9GAST|nr:hypothetical protein PoB_005374200 [Plakobranchus ocellatus]
MSITTSFPRNTCCLLLFIVFQGAYPQRGCPIVEEGTFESVVCSRPNTPFKNFGLRVEIKGNIYEAGSCNSSGYCSVVDDSRYRATFSSDNTTRKVNVFVKNINRTVTRILCYEDDALLSDVWCWVRVYVKASKLIYEGPRFVDGDTSALITFTSKRVYPGGTCGFKLKGANLTTAHYKMVRMSKSESVSHQYPGDKEIVCHLRVNVAGIPEGIFRFRPLITPDLPGISESASTLGDELPPLSLSATRLFRPFDNNNVIKHPVSGQLRINVTVTGNPPPNHISLSRRRNSTLVTTVSEQDYSVMYIPNSGDENGVINLAFVGGLDECTTSHFTLNAGNGVIGGTKFQYNFTVKSEYTTPSKPSCDRPKFVDGGTACVITCTSERVYPMGKCNFIYTGGSSLNQELEQTVSNEDSTKFPGHKKVTCQLRVPVTGNKEGSYMFQVEVTPDMDNIPACAKVAGDPLPAVNLKPISLSNPGDNDLVFDYPLSGELELDIQLIGNPEPNRVLLFVSGGTTSTMPSLTSKDYRWKYQRTAENYGGVLKLVVTGGFQQGASTTYILRAGNGMIGKEEFEYKFFVNDGAAVTEGDADHKIPLLVGLAVGAAVIVLILVVIFIAVLRRWKCPPKQSCPDSSKQASRDSSKQATHNSSNAALPKGYLYPNTAFYLEPSACISDDALDPPF